MTTIIVFVKTVERHSAPIPKQKCSKHRTSTRPYKIMKKFILGLTLMLAPWIIFALIAASTRSTSTFALVVTLAISAFGLTILITKSAKKP